MQVVESSRTRSTWPDQELSTTTPRTRACGNERRTTPRSASSAPWRCVSPRTTNTKKTSRSIKALELLNHRWPGEILLEKNAAAALNAAPIVIVGEQTYRRAREV